MEKSQNLTSDPSFNNVLDLIATLRGENGCPWDREQTPDSLCPCLIEEAYELVEAIQARDTDAIREELGDVLFQVLFFFNVYQDADRMTVGDVVAENIAKMTRRHPHVFGQDKIDTAGGVIERWKEIKQEEKGQAEARKSILDSVPSGMPGLMRAMQISEKAVGAGFEWDSLQDVIAQVESEWAEFKAELRLDQADARVDMDKAAMEFGDVLFSMVNVARKAGLHPETALGHATQKFIQRFQNMESLAAEKNMRFEDLPREEMEALWQVVKRKA